MLYWSSAVSDPDTRSTAVDYKADVYVLAMVHHQDPETLDLLDLRQWSFFVLNRDELQEVAKNRSSVSLVCLQKAGRPPLSFAELPEHLK